MKIWLLDTGPWVAYLDPRDRDHERITEALDDFSGQLATTSAVVTEAMYFVRNRRGGPQLLAAFALESGLAVFDYADPQRLVEASDLMEGYADTPMDYADATLVLLAQDLESEEILTLDLRGFSTYRTREGRPFDLTLHR